MYSQWKSKNPKNNGISLENHVKENFLDNSSSNYVNYYNKIFNLRLDGWSDSIASDMDNFRSIFDTAILKSLDISDVIYFSIAKNIPKISELQLIDFTNEFVDFADTAAFLQNLDLIISVDTSIINLAGALGLPAILMNYYGHDWRWGITGIESIWYSAIRIIRQEKFNDWCPVIEQVRKHIDFWKENIP